MDSDDSLDQYAELAALLPQLVAADRKAVLAFARARAAKYRDDSESAPVQGPLIFTRNVGGVDLVNADRRKF
jgi:hypothetical protein